MWVFQSLTATQRCVVRSHICVMLVHQAAIQCAGGPLVEVGIDIIALRMSGIAPASNPRKHI